MDRMPPIDRILPRQFLDVIPSMDTAVQATPDRWNRLRQTRLCLRSDLQISRQSAHGKPIYVIFDPVSFQSYRFTLDDYRVAGCLDGNRTLDEAFTQCVSEGHLKAEDQADYWQFIERLLVIGLLNGSIANGDYYHQRFEQKRRNAQRTLAIQFLFLTIPLVNPDRFLDKTVGYFRFLFSSLGILFVSLLGIVAIAVATARWDAFIQPLNGLLAFRNLLFMSLAFIFLKVWHELGHGYACKNFGGRVTEMGCKLLVGIPLAYVDASSAWSFAHRYQRILVMLGGMYFELLIAIPATLVWAATPDSWLGAWAYQLIFMAGVATIFFNANPLLKYDGYFVLSELLAIPNLRSRANAETLSWIKRWTLGLPPSVTAKTGCQRWVLIGYGIASNIYAAMLMVTIPMMVATRFQTLGLLLAAVQLGGVLYSVPRRLFHYLLQAKETEPVRWRARGLAAGMAIGLPAVLALAPVPTGIVVDGVVSAEQSAVVRTTAPGLIQRIETSNLDNVVAQQPLVVLQNVDLETSFLSESISADTTLRNAKYVRHIDVGESTRLFAVAQEHAQAMQHAARAAADLTIRAPFAGRINYILPDRQLGTFIAAGTVVAKVAAGKARIRSWITEADLNAASVQPGTEVKVRLLDGKMEEMNGTIVSVAPATASDFQDFALTTLGEGDMVADPVTGQPVTRLFQLQVAIPDLEGQQVNQDLRAAVRLPRQYEPFASWIVRHTQRFVLGIFAN